MAKAMKPEAAAASSPRRIEFHPPRKPFSPIARAREDFHLEILKPSTDSHRLDSSPGGRAAAAAGKKRSECVDFYEHGLDKELSFRITFRKIVSPVLFLV